MCRKRPSRCRARSALEEICGRLPADQRAVLLLRILADLTVEQVARLLEKTVPAIKAMQRRGLASLRSDLSDLSDLSAPLCAEPAMTDMR